MPKLYFSVHIIKVLTLFSFVFISQQIVTFSYVKLVLQL